MGRFRAGKRDVLQIYIMFGQRLIPVSSTVGSAECPPRGHPYVGIVTWEGVAERLIYGPHSIWVVPVSRCSNV